MKKITLRLLSLLIVAVMLFSALMQTVSASTIGKDESFKYSQQDVQMVGGAGTIIASAVGKWLLGRALQEVQAFLVSSDVPILGGIAKLTLTPNERADMIEREQVAEILDKVNAMEESLSRIENQLSNINARITELSNEIEELKAAMNKLEWQVASLAEKEAQHTSALAYQSALHQLHNISDKYISAWSAYARMNEAITSQKAINDEMKETTDSARLKELEDQYNETDTLIVSMRDAFINILSEGGGFQFAADLGALKNCIWDANNPSASFLGAYEAYLRSTVPFEHQITNDLIIAMQSCTDTMNHIFLMYTEYYTYMKVLYPDNTAYSTYTEEYFEIINNDMLEYLCNMAENCGVSTYMLEAPLPDETVASIKEEDPNFVLPECIDTTVTINGTTYPCYKVRSNTDYQYYIILKTFVSNKQIVSKASVNHLSDNTINIFRPTFILDHTYTDDGLYKLVSANNLPTFIKNSYSGVLSHLRLNGSLTELPQNIEHILLYDNSCSLSGNSLTWNVKALNVNNTGFTEAEKISSSKIFDGQSGCKAIAVYQCIENNIKYQNQTFTAIDKAQIEGKEITISNGQTLDLTQITVDISNVTIHMVGGGTIKSNPHIKLKNSEIRISAKDAVTIENVNITARSDSYAAIKIIGENAAVSFVGTNTASGSQRSGSYNADYYKNYIFGMPLLASHGIYASNNTSILIDGTTTATGADGGAGVCAVGKLNIAGKSSSAKLIAKGSSSNKSGIGYQPETVGAGIGGSFGASTITYETVNPSTGETTQSNEFCSNKTVDYIGSNANININIANLDVSGASTSYCTSYDIGGVNANGTLRDVAGGSISNTTINAKTHLISSKISTQNQNNLFNPEVYVISAFTHGSSGVTKSGVKFKLHGTRGSSSWITASSCGKSKGDWSESFIINSVGIITSVEVKTISDNTWFPGDITVSAKYGGETLTVYGGRWIGTTAKTLSPSDAVYKVIIYTGSDTYSGTNSDIFLKLKDANGKETEEYQLDDIHYNTDAFERDDRGTFYIYAPSEFGECVGAYLRSDNSGVSPDWKMEQISIQRVSGENKDTDKYTVSAGFWFNTELTVNFGKYSGATGAFHIEVKTSNEKQAGTDSNIFLKLNGKINPTDKNYTSTNYIDIDNMADTGNNFEKGDLDSMFIGFNTAGIGDILQISVDKDNFGVGPGWHLAYINVKEIISDEEAKTAQNWKFSYGDWVYDDVVELTRREAIKDNTTLKSSIRLDREILSSLTANDDGSYTLTINKELTLGESAFEYIAEKNAILNVVMKDGDKTLYEICFNGNAFDTAETIVLGKNYSFADGRMIFNFLKEAEFPADTTIKIHTSSLNFEAHQAFYVFVKDENEAWIKKTVSQNENGIIEFKADKLREAIISQSTNAWVSYPEISDWSIGENPLITLPTSLFGTANVRYTGVADDGSSWDSTEIPQKAGKYTATFSVEATPEYDGLNYSVEFNVNKSEDSSLNSSLSNNNSGGGSPSNSNQSSHSEKKLTWLWIVMASVIAFGSGVAITYLAFSKKIFFGKKQK